MVASPSPPTSDLKLENSSGGLSLGEKVRGDFPILNQEAYPGKPLVYLDSAATSQKPASVIATLDQYYTEYNSNVHRGAHSLSIRSTEAYEAARDKVRTFINAEDRKEIVFTRGATEAINLVAYSWGDANINAGDEIVLTVMEHHSNMVPWQLLAARRGATLKFARLNADMSLDMDHYLSLLGPRTKLVACVHASNALGCINPVRAMADAAHAVGARILVDACQSVPTMRVDVQQLGVDWLVASGHKMCGPTGIGFLYGRLELLRSMAPWQGGGEMIDEVFFDHSTFAEPPSRFEAGTPAIAQAIGLGAAVDYLSAIGMDAIEAYEHELAVYLWDRVAALPAELTLYGPPPNAAGDNRNPLLAFNARAAHAHDLSFFIDQEGVAVRAGHHCTQALHRSLGAAGSIRASCYLYNTRADVDAFVVALEASLAFLGGEGGAGGGDFGLLL
ncbi:cysteine desulfurase [Tribonema minus]|uniref:cysteine desulfurase n=1 Tax=Tribonema minus TaxID=303371 RepID=A0A835YHC6_9STRA|nr:cysteine desulfurase [Tribonema minus]